MLQEREGGTTRLEEAVTAYRDALQESTRERVPLLRLHWNTRDTTTRAIARRPARVPLR
jgi:hypothetical protein